LNTIEWNVWVIVTNGLEMIRRKRFWSKLRHCPDIYLKDQRKTAKNFRIVDVLVEITD
jgi:hypothetical protein